ncbi:MAG: CAP domain-containing protein [Candidatus Bathyarchaeota archaeon]|nr:CAP domain-containing protein [Candidatus Bathyarchaeota archaeon]
MNRFIDVKLKPGHIPRKQLAFTLILFCLLTASIIRYYGGTGEVKEIREVQYELHSIAFEQVNNARRQHGVSLLDYDSDLDAQEHAWSMMDRGEAYHNPDLASSMVECVSVYTEKGIDPDIAITLMIHRMVYDEALSTDGEKILDPEHELVGIGVAVDGDSVFLVLDFS